jgi:PAS domain S-box-containing protein
MTFSDAMAAPRAPARRVQTRDGADRHEQDVAAVLLVTRGRVVLATALVLCGSLVRHRAPSADLLLTLSAYVWVPVAAVLALAASTRTVRFVRIAGAAGDLGMLFAVHWLTSGSATVALAGYSLVVVLGAYTGGRQFGLALAAAAMGLVLLGDSITPGVGLGRSVVALFAATLALLLVVVDRAASEQRRAEARSVHLASKAEAILARVADAVIVTDTIGSIVEANPAAEQLVGAIRLNGRRCHDVLSLCVGERKLDCTTGCGLLGLAQMRTTTLGHEVWRSRADGSRQPVLANASPLYSGNGELVEVVHSLRDITRLKQADEAKTLFLATASHELKTPLTVIRGFAETLLRNELPDPVRQQGLEAIATRARELTGIVERLLLSSRIEAGRLLVETSTVDVTPIVRERVQAVAGATGRRVDVNIADGSTIVSADDQAIATVVDHLLDNAIKYSPDGAPVRVSVTGDREVVRIDIADTGVGMDAEQAAHCFEKFWQADSTDRRRFGGTGIGLYIVLSLTEGMGGSVDVRSGPGNGSVFSVALRRPDAAGPGGADATDAGNVGVGERTMVREFMRQLGVPVASGAPRP